MKDGTGSGPAVISELERLADRDLHEVGAVLYAAAYELSFRSGDRPRSIFDTAFCTCPADREWTERIKPMLLKELGRDDG